MRRLPLSLAAFLVLLAVGAVGHVLLTGARHRAHDLAVLRALGITPRQAAACVSWQATVIGIITVAIGVPAGLIIGRAVWRLTADSLSFVYVGTDRRFSHSCWSCRGPCWCVGCWRSGPLAPPVAALPRRSCAPSDPACYGHAPWGCSTRARSPSGSASTRCSRRVSIRASHTVRKKSRPTPSSVLALVPRSSTFTRAPTTARKRSTTTATAPRIYRRAMELTALESDIIMEPTNLPRGNDPSLAIDVPARVVARRPSSGGCAARGRQPRRVSLRPSGVGHRRATVDRHQRTRVGPRRRHSRAPR